MRHVDLVLYYYTVCFHVLFTTYQNIQKYTTIIEMSAILIRLFIYNDIRNVQVTIKHL